MAALAAAPADIATPLCALTAVAAEDTADEGAMVAAFSGGKQQTEQREEGQCAQFDIVHFLVFFH